MTYENSMSLDLEAYQFHQSLAEGLAHKALLENERVHTLARLSVDQSNLAASHAAKYLKEFKPITSRVIPSFWYTRHGAIDHIRHSPDPWNFDDYPIAKMASFGDGVCLLASVSYRVRGSDIGKFI